MLSLFANYVDKTVWEDMESDSYILVNSVLSCRTGGVDIGLSVYNLLNNRHQEHPQGMEIGRTAVLNLTYQIE